MRARIVALLIAGFLLAPGLAAQGATPDAGAIQTQIADLQATLTAIAGTPTPSAMEFDLVDPDGADGDPPFHVEIQSLRRIGATFYDNLYDKTLFAKGVYVAISLRVTSLGSEPVPGWSKYVLLLRDDKGRAFSYDDDATRTLTFNYNLYSPSFQPGLTYSQVIVYDVAKDATSFTLEVEGASIRIPLGRAH